MQILDAWDCRDNNWKEIMSGQDPTRVNEWFVPKFGPESFRVFVGLLYLPYTGMCISFVVFGSLLAGQMHWDRLVAIIAIYFLGLGISAHAADALGSRKIKPWGRHFSKSQLLVLTVMPLALAYAIGLYYIVFYVPALGPVAVAEGFFLFAYNFEWFAGRFHTDFWFCVAWGALPLIAGYVIQTGTVNAIAILASVPAGLVSYSEIVFSRPYKKLKMESAESDSARGLEKKLKAISTCTVSAAVTLVALRLLVS